MASAADLSPFDISNLRMRFLLVTALLVSAFLVVSADVANQKLKKCCSRIKGEDTECIERFCDFDAISQTNVSQQIPTLQFKVLDSKLSVNML